jgi:hypothetical protein
VPHGIFWQPDLSMIFQAFALLHSFSIFFGPSKKKEKKKNHWRHMWGVFEISWIGFYNTILTPHSFSVTLFTLGFRLFFIQLQINQPSLEVLGLNRVEEHINICADCKNV